MFKQTIVSTVCALSAGIAMAGGINANSEADLSASSAAAVHAQSANHEQDAQLQSAARAQSSAGVAFDTEKGASFEGSHSSEADTNARSQHASNNHSEASGRLATNSEQIGQQLDQRQSHLRGEAEATLGSAGNAAAAAQGQASARATQSTQLVAEGGNTAILVLGERRAAVEAKAESHAANAGSIASTSAANFATGIEAAAATSAALVTSTATTAQSSVAGAADSGVPEPAPVKAGVAVQVSATNSLAHNSNTVTTSELQSMSTVAGSVDADLSQLNDSRVTEAQIASEVVAEVDAAVSAAIAESVSQAVTANVQNEVSNSLAQSLGANL